MEGDLQRTFGENLRAYREAKGMSQQQLADVFDHDDSYTGGIERGERNMSLKVVERLCAVIGVDPLQMLTPSGEPAPSKEPQPSEQAESSDEAAGDEQQPDSDAAA